MDLVQAAYHRPTPPAVKSNAAAMALAAAQWTNKKVECPTDEVRIIFSSGTTSDL